MCRVSTSPVSLRMNAENPLLNATVERRFPWLSVVTIGNPSWVTAEKYAEIVTDWIKPSMRFDLDHPTGWLAESDETLGGSDR